MKQRHLLLLALAGFIASCTNSPQATATGAVTQSFKVWGNCDHCKATIEKAAALPGVSNASWSEGTDTLTVKLDTAVTSVDLVLKAVAESGYDNERYTANTEAYQQLPECCQYERKSN